MSPAGLPCFYGESCKISYMLVLPINLLWVSRAHANHHWGARKGYCVLFSALVSRVVQIRSLVVLFVALFPSPHQPPASSGLLRPPPAFSTVSSGRGCRRISGHCCCKRAVRFRLPPTAKSTAAPPAPLCCGATAAGRRPTRLASVGRSTALPMAQHQPLHRGGRKMRRLQ